MPFLGTVGGASIRNFGLGSGKGSLVLNVSPAVLGKTSWDLIEDGNLVLEAGTEYTITNPSASLKNIAVKLWGGGSSGQGGFTSGTYALAGNSSIKCRAGAAGTSNQGGGGASAIYSSSDANTVYAVAGGGGGAGNGATGGGHGGGTTGNAGSQCTGWTAYGGGGGTQSAGGSGGTGDRGSGGSGSFRQGGAGSGNSTVYAGGTGWAPGGIGQFKSGDGTQGGGGGGYYGGGGGGASACGGGGGGGSGYIGGLADAQTTAQTTVGYGTDPLRGFAGDPGTNGKIILIYLG